MKMRKGTWRRKMDDLVYFFMVLTAYLLQAVFVFWFCSCNAIWHSDGVWDEVLLPSIFVYGGECESMEY